MLCYFMLCYVIDMIIIVKMAGFLTAWCWSYEEWRVP